jgi:hypothetical protein
MLISGLQLYHLRPDCSFHTHKSFERVAEAIPANSTVILVIGAIDCVETLARSRISALIQKLKYESADDAAEQVGELLTIGC